MVSRKSDSKRWCDSSYTSSMQYFQVELSGFVYLKSKKPRTNNKRFQFLVFSTNLFTQNTKTDTQILIPEVYVKKVDENLISCSLCPFHSCIFPDVFVKQIKTGNSYGLMFEKHIRLMILRFIVIDVKFKGNKTFQNCIRYGNS